MQKNMQRPWGRTQFIQETERRALWLRMMLKGPLVLDDWPQQRSNQGMLRSLSYILKNNENKCMALSRRIWSNYALFSMIILNAIKRIYRKWAEWGWWKWLLWSWWLGLGPRLQQPSWRKVGRLRKEKPRILLGYENRVRWKDGLEDISLSAVSMLITFKAIGIGRITWGENAEDRKEGSQLQALRDNI